MVCDNESIVAEHLLMIEIFFDGPYFKFRQDWMTLCTLSICLSAPLSLSLCVFVHFLPQFVGVLHTPVSVQWHRNSSYPIASESFFSQNCQDEKWKVIVLLLLIDHPPTDCCSTHCLEDRKTVSPSSCPCILRWGWINNGRAYTRRHQLVWA